MFRSMRPVAQRLLRRASSTGRAAPPGGGGGARTGQQGPISWRALAVFGVAGTAGLGYYSVKKQARMEEIMRPQTVGKAAIGGAFSLVDGSSGVAVDETFLLGRWTLVYFGFTMCPDVCPAELTKVGEALTMLEGRGRRVRRDGKGGNVVTPVFISVDPARDSPERAAEYAAGFHKAFVGLSGSDEQVRQAAKAYRVYYSRDGGEGDEYLVDHSIITYLMDPGGEFREFYGTNSSAAEIAARVEAQMLAWKG